MQKDFDNSRRMDAPKPKKQPTKTATVSTPSPAPTPRGEAPRVTSKSQQVPTKDWSAKPIQQEPRGLDGTEQSKKDWDKTGSSSAPIDNNKDWGKKVERSQVKKAPAPRRDLDRSR